MPRENKPIEPRSKLHMPKFQHDGHKEDLEKGDVTSEHEKDMAKERKSVVMKRRDSHYHIVEKMINYHAIDFGDKCESQILAVCLGYRC